MVECKCKECRKKVQDNLLNKLFVKANKKPGYYTCARFRAPITSDYLNSLSSGEDIYDLHGPFELFEGVEKCYKEKILPRVDDDDYGMYMFDGDKWYLILSDRMVELD